MSKIVDSPIIAFFEDRPKQSMVYQLNLSVYLDAKVTFCTSLADLKALMAKPGGVNLAIVRADFQGSSIAAEAADLLLPAGIPLITLGGKERQGVVVVGDDNQVKPMLQAAAKILGITAKHMVGKERPEFYEIAPEFLNVLFSAPCDIYEGKSKTAGKVFSVGDIISRDKVAAFIKGKKIFNIDSLHRLRLANAVTEQSLLAKEQLKAANVPEEKKMTILAASLDMVAAQFKSSGMDAETVELANSSIQAIEKIADSATSVGKLLKQLMANEGGYRFAHSQLLTFLGFHVIKMMGWWGEEQRNIFSQAAFYHDISLVADDEARFRTNAELTAVKDKAKLERILTHAQLAARELQAVPDIDAEVVRVVIQHHGSPTGRGFTRDIAKLENLSKAFLLSEEWADYLIGLSESDKAPDNGAKIAELKAVYNDERCHQILETFRYLDPDQFTNDFLQAPDYLTSSDKADTGFAEALVSGSATVEEDASVALKGETPEEEVKTKIEGVTHVRKDEEILVKGEKEVVDDSEQSFGSANEQVDEEEINIKGEKAVVDKSKKKFEGVTDVRKDEEIHVKGEKAAKDLIDRSVVKFKADTPEEKKEMKIKALATSTELMKSALAGQLEPVTSLVNAASNAGVELRKTDAEGRCAIHYAAMGGSVPVLTFMKEKGAQMNALDSKRRSPLFLAAMHKHNEAFDYILANGGKIAQQAMGGMNIAMVAAFGGNMHILKIAVEKGVRLDTKDHNGKTAIEFAKLGKHAEAVAYLESVIKKAEAPKGKGAAANTTPAAA